MDACQVCEFVVADGGLDVEPKRSLAFVEFAGDDGFGCDFQEVDPEVGVALGTLSDCVVEVCC